METKFMDLPAGIVSIKKYLIDKIAVMTDREIADNFFKLNYYNSYYCNEIKTRKLWVNGMSKNDTYALINKREILALALTEIGKNLK